MILTATVNIHMQMRSSGGARAHAGWRATLRRGTGKQGLLRPKQQEVEAAVGIDGGMTDADVGRATTATG